jgi:hypothetical protein
VRQKKQFAQAQGAVLMNSMNHIHENWEFATENECETAYGCSALSNSGFNLTPDDNSSQGDTEYLSDDGVQSWIDQLMAEISKAQAKSDHILDEKLRNWKQEVLAIVQKQPDRTDEKLLVTIRAILTKEMLEMQCSNQQTNARMYDLKKDMLKQMGEITDLVKYMGKDLSEIHLRLAITAAEKSKSRSITPAGMYKAEHQANGLTIYKIPKRPNNAKALKGKCRNCDKEGHTWVNAGSHSPPQKGKNPICQRCLKNPLEHPKCIGTRHRGVTTVEKMGISLKNAESCKSICSHGVERVQNK